MNENAQLSVRQLTENSESGGAGNSWKIFATIIIIISCLVILYPNFLHPTIASIFGGSSKDIFIGKRDLATSFIQRPSSNAPLPRAQQNDNHKHPGYGNSPPLHMHPAAHSTLKSDQSHQSGRARWNWMLPCYTIGVLMLLIYTLIKIILKQSNRNHHQYSIRYNVAKESFEFDTPNNTSGTNEVDADNEDRLFANIFGSEELKRLHKRLAETEGAMHTILSELEICSRHPGHLTDAMKQTTLETLDSISPQSVGSAEELSQADVPYIRDLENALSEFKQLTETYIQQQSCESVVDQNIEECSFECDQATQPNSSVLPEIDLPDFVATERENQSSSKTLRKRVHVR